MAKHHHHAGGYSGRPDTFEHDTAGTLTNSSFPTGWLDAAPVDPASTTPQPSAVIIDTTDAYGHLTKALATLPAVAESQGIYRPIEVSDSYKTSADVRIDRFSDVDPTGLVEDPNNPGFLLCGCPVSTADTSDGPMQVGFSNLGGATDLLHSPFIGLGAYAETDRWHLLGITANTLADINTGVPIQLGKWYGVEIDFDAPTGALHAAITDQTLGTTLYDHTISLGNYGNYDPDVDGVFNTESFLDVELSLLFGTDPTLNTPGLAAIDNIDSKNRPATGGHGYGMHDRDDGRGHGLYSQGIGNDHGQWRDSLFHHGS